MEGTTTPARLQPPLPGRWPLTGGQLAGALDQVLKEKVLTRMSLSIAYVPMRVEATTYRSSLTQETFERLDH